MTDALDELMQLARDGLAMIDAIEQESEDSTP